MSASTRKHNRPGGKGSGTHREPTEQNEPSRGPFKRLGPGAKLLAGAVAAIVVLGAIFALSSRDPAGTKRLAGGSGYKFQVGSPGPGQPAPAIDLSGTDGKSFSLAGARGKNVLLYFQEGIGCQPCWDQIRDIERYMPKLAALGVDRVVSVTSDPLDLIKRKVSDEGIKTPVLADPGLVVSKTYSANQFGMMGTSRDGHTFILVGPDGRIRWRADYGGPPDFTMYVPVKGLVADLTKGLTASGS